MKTGYRTAFAFAPGVGLAGGAGGQAQEPKKEQQKKGGGKARSWDEVADAAAAYLKTTQADDGSWGNDFGTWMEGDPDLDTAYALIALSYTKPKN